MLGNSNVRNPKSFSWLQRLQNPSREGSVKIKLYQGGGIKNQKERDLEPNAIINFVITSDCPELGI